MRRPARRRAGTVAAIVAAVVVMGAGVALLATAWRTQRDAVAAAGLVARGQAGVWYDALIGEFDDGKAPSRGLLDAFVAANAEDGLRAVVVVGGKGEVLADGGLPLGTLRPRDLATSGEVVEVGDRVRVVLTGPVRVRRNQARRQNPPQALRVVIEFVDDAGRDLRASARRTLWIGGATAAGCFVAAGLLLAWWRRRDRATAAAAHAQRLASLGQMSATMAHELRNPLASLKGNAQLLARMLPEGERSRGKADLVVSEAMRLEALTGELLEFARTGTIERTPVAIDDLLADVTAAVRSTQNASSGLDCFFCSTSSSSSAPAPTPRTRGTTPAPGCGSCPRTSGPTRSGRRSSRRSSPRSPASRPGRCRRTTSPSWRPWTASSSGSSSARTPPSISW